MAKLILDKIPMISTIRRNHSLEHATMHVLSERFIGLGMAGISGLGGFYLLADLPSETIVEAAIEAAKRLKAGETELAIHDRCGTNLGTPFALAFLSYWAMMIGTGQDAKRKVRRMPFAVILAVGVFFLARPLGPMMQRLLTTSESLENLQVGYISTQKYYGRSLHHVITHD